MLRKPSFLRLQKLFAKSGYTVVKVRERYFEDGLFTVHSDQFRRDPEFRTAYERGVKASRGYDPRFEWRIHIALWAAHNCLASEGDFVECGVNAGFVSSAIMQYLDWNRFEKQFFLVDTFAGPVMSQYSTEEIASGRAGLAAETITKGGYVTDLHRIRANFAEWRKAIVVQGEVPEILERIAFREVAFVHLDMNCAFPESRALDFFLNRLSPGGMILPKIVRDITTKVLIRKSHSLGKRDGGVRQSWHLKPLPYMSNSMANISSITDSASRSGEDRKGISNP